MTTDEAVKILENGDWWSFCDIPCDLQESKELHEALDVVLSAIRAQQEANAKCPCRLRDYMELEDCDKTDCVKCCPVAKGDCR